MRTTYYNVAPDQLHRRGEATIDHCVNRRGTDYESLWESPEEPSEFPTLASLKAYCDLNPNHRTAVFDCNITAPSTVYQVVYTIETEEDSENLDKFFNAKMEEKAVLAKNESNITFADLIEMQIQKINAVDIDGEMFPNEWLSDVSIAKIHEWETD